MSHSQVELLRQSHIVGRAVALTVEEHEVIAMADGVVGIGDRVIT